MTISDGNNRWSLPGNGSQTVFPFGNKIFRESDLKIYVDGLLQSETLYAVTGIGSEAGGNITFGTAPSDLSTVLIVRDVPGTQATDIPLAGTFPSRAIEDAFDKLTILHQQNSDRIDRALAVGGCDPDSFGAMPLLATFFSKYLAFDAVGNPVPGASISDQVMTAAADTFDGTGAQTVFTLSADAASAASTAVFISGVRQVPGTDYTVSVATLTFTTAPALGTGNILAVHLQAYAGVPSDLSVTTAKIVAGAVLEAAIGSDAVDWQTKIKAATAGDLPVFDNSGDPALLAKGTALQLLRMNAGATALEYFSQSAAIFSEAYVSPEQTITVAGSLTLTHGLSAAPALIQTRLICKTAEKGYSVGDELIVQMGANSASGADNMGTSIVPDTTNLNIRFGSRASVTFMILNKTTGTFTTTTNANWKLVVRAWA